MVKSPNQIRTELSEIQQAHLQLNSFFWGDFLRAYKEQEVQYPLMGAFYPNGTFLKNQTQIQLTIYVADKVYKDYSNLNDVESDTLQICRDIYQVINQSTRWNRIGRVQSCSVTKFIERGGDEVAGHTMTFQFILRDTWGVCDIPMFDYDFDQVIGGGCLPVQIYRNGLLVATVEPGGVYEYTVEDATQVITDSEGNELYSNAIPSGATETQPIQDTQISINSTPVASVLAEGSKDITVELDGTPSGTWNESTQTWEVVSDPCAPVDVYIGEATAGSFPSGTDVFVKVIQDGFEVIPEDITVTGDEIEVVLVDSPDTTVNVNGNLFATVPSGGTENVPVVNEGSNPVGTISGGQVVVANSDVFINTIQVGDIDAEDSLSINVTLDGVDSGSWNAGTQTWEVVGVPSPPPIGATLMKTGQTTSYRTGDDGDIEAGRATDFFTLSGNNPFGNTNRFTDELGGQTYVNNIVIDWSTYNGATVLGYKRTVNTNVTWDNAIDNSSSYSVGSFVSGWRLANIKEMQNIANYELTQVLNYAPFSHVGDHWTSTTAKIATSLAFVFGGSNGDIYRQVKANTSPYKQVRTFTVTGTTLT